MCIQIGSLLKLCTHVRVNLYLCRCRPRIVTAYLEIKSRHSDISRKCGIHLYAWVNLANFCYKLTIKSTINYYVTRGKRRPHYY